jgi:hypothetical protein
VSVADADFVASAALVAVKVTVVEAATEAGAVYNPPVETVPTLEFPPVAPFTDQVTLVFVVPETVAVNCCVFPAAKVAVVGETDTLTVTAGWIVTFACANRLVSAMLVAATAAVVKAATDAGAVNNPPVEIVPTLEFPPVTPFTVHVTPVFVLPDTVAVNCCVFPADSVAEVGDTDTLTGNGTCT